jgi:sugar O-acyltransferase (sialic acid O-acetyltransferase NeuD family)
MDICIIGAGGHGEVVLDVIRAAAMHRVVGFFDSNPEIQGKVIDGVEVIGPPEWADKPFLVAIGDVYVRKELTDLLMAKGLEPITVIHPTAYCAGNAQVGPGSVICAKATLCTHVRAGRGAIINTGAIIEHHCRLGEFVHIAPGAVLTGRVTVGDQVMVGAAATIISCLTIGQEAVIGAGSVVTHDIPAHMTAVGAPARIVGSGH